MLELSPFRKNKINLEDYDYQSDIQNRILIAHLSNLEFQILEEIIYSPLTISMQSLAESLQVSQKHLEEQLLKLARTGLYSMDNDLIRVNKEVRKYFEHELAKFENSFFVPNLDFLRSLLKKVPIHVLPCWYHIPKSSNNIFDSLVEKYLITPQVFDRYLKELNLGDQILTNIVEEVFSSAKLKIPSDYIKNKYHLNREKFEECMLHLEFNFVCCLGYEKSEDTWNEFITPFQEWREYLLFLRKTAPESIKNSEDIQSFRSDEYAFVDDICLILSQIAQKKSFVQKDMPQVYRDQLIAKALQIHLIEEDGDAFKLTSAGEQWMQFSTQDKALYIYRHPLNQMVPKAYEHLATEKNIRDIEKSIARVVDLNWVYFEDFMEGILIPLSSNTTVSLKKIGRRWKYALPIYTEEEQNLIRAVIMNGLFETGMIIKGFHEDKECFKVTSLGKSLFAC